MGKTLQRDGTPLVVLLSETIAEMRDTTPEELDLLIGNHIPVEAAELLASSQSVNKLQFDIAEYSITVKPETVTVQTAAPKPE